MADFSIRCASRVSGAVDYYIAEGPVSLRKMTPASLGEQLKAGVTFDVIAGTYRASLEWYDVAGEVRVRTTPDKTPLDNLSDLPDCQASQLLIPST